MAFVNEFLDLSDPPSSLDNGDYFGFGEPFFAPASGVVSFVSNDAPDSWARPQRKGDPTASTAETTEPPPWSWKG